MFKFHAAMVTDYHKSVLSAQQQVCFLNSFDSILGVRSVMVLCPRRAQRLIVNTGSNLKPLNRFNNYIFDESDRRTLQSLRAENNLSIYKHEQKAPIRVPKCYLSL